MIDSQTFFNLGLVVVFVLVGGIFSATELALVSLRESQVNQLAQRGSRGERVAAIARDPNRFLSAVQIGVTVAGFFSAAYGGSTLAPDIAPYLTDVGFGEDTSETVALVLMTLLIAYLSLVLGELVPKRLALQRPTQVATMTGPPLDRFATLMRPVIWVLSISTNAIVRLLGADPNATSDEVTTEELRDIVTTHEGLATEERQILTDVFAATNSNLKEVMTPRGDVAFVRASMTLTEAAVWCAEQHYSRFPVIAENFDHVTGFLHVRDLLRLEADDTRLVSDIQRPILHLPGTNGVLPTVATMRESGDHLSIVVDEFGGTDGIVTLEDLVEEIVGDIYDEYDARVGGGLGQDEPGRVGGSSPAHGPLPRLISAGLTIEDFAETTGISLPDGDYETVAGYVLSALGEVPEVGAVVTMDDHQLTVSELVGRRITQVEVSAIEPATDPEADDTDGTRTEIG